MPRSWLLRRGAKVVGPVSDTQLVAMAKSGKLVATDEVSTNKGETWSKASTIKGLSLRSATPVPSAGENDTRREHASVTARPDAKDGTASLDSLSTQVASPITSPGSKSASQPASAATSGGRSDEERGDNPTLACLLALSIAVIVGLTVTAYLWLATTWFSRPAGSIIGAFLVGVPTLGAIAVPYGVAAGICRLVGIPLSSNGIINAQGLSDDQIRQELKNGAQLICFQYCISIIVMTFSNPSAVYLVRRGESTLSRSLGFSLVSLVLGPWGLPWGPIYTIGTIAKNVSGGLNLTRKFLQD